MAGFDQVGDAQRHADRVGRLEPVGDENVEGLLAFESVLGQHVLCFGDQPAIDECVDEHGHGRRGVGGSGLPLHLQGRAAVGLGFEQATGE
ncbi:MAG: hypothetical protein ACT4NY_27915 [Pseudonocardiales bacterium]